ncbi:MAG TPA: 2-oxo acid dehydrogenase subunit E2, partial [Saprospiraceae bacterium]|nr:2-oxo acid dehydrogenase subunit E2 [Saprospiraceae bacterium]
MSLIELKVPTIGESVTEVTLSKWLKADGDLVKLDEPLCEFESDKATLEFPSEAAGRLIHVAKEGDDLAIGAIVARIDTAAQPAAVPESTKVPDADKTVELEVPQSTNYAKGLASPAASKMLAESGIDPAKVQGTGKGGRVTHEDAQLAVSKAPISIEPSMDSKKSAPLQRQTRREKLSRMRKTISKRLVSAKNETAMLTTFNEVDLTAIQELRARYNEAYQAKYGIKIGFMSLFAKACSSVLLQMPEVNAQLDG